MLIGLAIGLFAIGSAHGRIAAAFLFPLADPVVLAIVAGVLAAAAGLASSIPAIRAARVDPASSLRAE